MTPQGYSLFDATGQRKYPVEKETLKFLKASDSIPDDKRLFCQVLFYTGCRVSEALALTPTQVDAGALCLVFRTLKRRKMVYRAVPIPPWLMRDLVAHCWAMPRDRRIWPWCRQTAWRYVKTIFDGVGVCGRYATPRGLRHAFGIATADKNVPPALTQRWMGHARLESTAVYQQAMGQEERNFAKRLWHDHTKLRG